MKESSKSLLLWFLRLVSLIAAGILAWQAQSKMPGTIEASRLGAQRWMGAAAGFRLYGWAGLCFVLACLPAFPRNCLRPRKPHRYAGEILAVLGAAFVLLGLGWLYWARPYMLGFLPLFAGFAFWGVAYDCLRKNPESGGGQSWEMVYSPPPQASSRPRWHWIVAHLLVWLGIALGFLALAGWYREIHQSRPFYLLGAGLLLSAAGLYLRDRWQGIPLLTRKDLPQLWEIPFLLIILGVAIYLRFWMLDRIPVGIWFDEAEMGLESRRILEGAAYSPMGAYSHNPSLSFYYNAFLLWLLGDSLWTLRGAVALSGVAAVAGMYLLAREMFGRWAGLIASFLLACGFWHVNFSRFNMPNVHAPLCAIGLFYFLFRGIRNGRWLDFWTAGILLGIGMHSYTGFRVVPPVLVPWALAAMAFQRGFLRRYGYPLALTAIFGLLAFGPLASYAVRDWKTFMARTDETSVFRDNGRTDEQKWADFEKNLIEHYQMFHYWGDRNPRHGLPAHPKVDFVSGILMLLGLALAWYRWRDPRFLLLPLWLALGLMAGILSLEFESPQTARTVALIPVPCLLGGVALDQLRRLLAERRPSSGRYLFGLAALPLMAFVFQQNFDIYFNQQMKRGDTWSEFSGLDTAVARFMATLSKYDICYNNNATTRQSSYLLPEKVYIHRDFFTFRDLPPLEPVREDQRVVYVLENWRTPLPQRLWEHFFPQGRFEQKTNPNGEPVFFTFTVSGRELEDRRGLLARFQQDHPDGTRVQREIRLREPSIAPGDWLSRGGAEFPADLSMEALVYLPVSGSYRFQLEGGFEGQGFVGDEEISWATPSRPLVRGWNALRIQGVWDGQSDLRLFWQPPSASRMDPIPAQHCYGLRLPSFGLLGEYYANLDRSGTPSFRPIDPQLDFRWHPDPPTLGNRWSARWSGYLDAPSDGRYLFKMASNDQSQLWLDGHRILQQQGGGWPETRVELKKGLHPIRVEYRQGTGYSSLRVRWVVPGRGEEPLGGAFLLPAREAEEIPAD